MRLWAGSLRGNRWTSGASDFTGEAASRGERVRDPSLLQPVAETPVLLPTRVTKSVPFPSARTSPHATCSRDPLTRLRSPPPPRLPADLFPAASAVPWGTGPVSNP